MVWVWWGEQLAQGRIVKDEGGGGKNQVKWGLVS